MTILFLLTIMSAGFALLFSTIIDDSNYPAKYKPIFRKIGLGLLTLSAILVFIMLAISLVKTVLLLTLGYFGFKLLFGDKRKKLTVLFQKDTVA